MNLNRVKNDNSNDYYPLKCSGCFWIENSVLRCLAGFHT